MNATAEAETIDSLRVHVRRSLDRFFMGQYYTEYGLSEEERLIPDDVGETNLEGCGLTDKHSPFQKFLRVVASEIVKEKGETKGRKKRIKEYLEVLQAFQDDWVQYIRKNMRKKVKQAVTPSISEAPAAAKEVINNDNDDSTVNKKKGGKRGPRGPYKKRKKKEEIPPAAAAAAAPAPEKASPARKRQKVLDIDQLRKGFEEERDAILEEVPEFNKKMFKQVGFAKWSKSYLPAMSLNPFSVPPGDIRDQWMKMYHNVKQKDRMNKFGHLVWWIGSKEEMGTYSVVARHHFMTYEEGVKKGMHELPKKIKRLIADGKKLSKAQEEEMEGLQQLNELAVLAPHEREHPRGDFLEEDFWGYDAGIVEGDDIDDDEDEDLVDDEEDLVDSDTDEPAETTKKRKYKKRKKEGIVIDEDGGVEEVIYDDIVEVPPGPPEKKKDEKTKLERGRKKKKVNGDLTGAPNEEFDVQMDQTPRDAEPMQVPLSSPLATTVPAKEARHSMEDIVAEYEASASGDSALDDSDYGGDDVEEDEELGKEVIVPTKKMKKLKKKGSKNGEKKRMDDSEEKSARKGEKEKTEQHKKDKIPKQHKKRSKAAEQRDLERCEEEYLPLINKLRASKDKKDAAEVQKLLEALLPVAGDFSASFFSEYEIPKIMKTTKTVLEELQKDTSTYRKLWNKMKASYTEKVQHVPEGFKPKKVVKRNDKLAKPRDGEERGPKIAEEEVSTPSQSMPLRDPEQVSVKLESESLHVPSGRQTDQVDGVSIKEEKRRLSTTSQQTEKAASSQPKPKKFSVMDFMRKKKEGPRDLTPGLGAGGKQSEAPSQKVSQKKAIPFWVTATPPSTFGSFSGSPRREDRLFALDFLLQAAAHFPAGKGVNEESVARALESAIYDWSENSSTPSNWSDNYWDKVHAVVAAITGKREIGTLVGMIMDGQFSTAKSIVTLSEENLEYSFESRPLLLNSD